MLQDGMAHLREHIISECLEDELADAATLAGHLSAVRKKLAAQGYGVALEIKGGKYYYRMVRFIGSAAK